MTSRAAKERDEWEKQARDLARERDQLKAVNARLLAPIEMRLNCPACSELHLDEGEFADKPHHTHACQHCGNVWRPAIPCTVGVRFLPGFRNKP